ncbi:MAG: hypothetical protein RI947_557 [Candidatus Parcubacteria bacterium]|jgi:prepilin-type N-terminal cleavage/methylation domain-containing protein
MKLNRNTHKGFTLIEVIVVIAVIGMIIPAIFSVIVAILQQELKIYQLSEVKRQGDTALAIIESTVKLNAVSINDAGTGGNAVCDDAGDTGDADYFRDDEGNWFRFSVSNDRIASSSSIVNATNDITKSTVVVSDFALTCSRPNGAAPPLINVQFTVSAGGTSTRQEERASITYRTKLKLRNY